MHYQIIEDKKTGNFCVCYYVFGLLLMNPQGKLLKTYNVSNGLPCNSVTGIEMDPEGILWLSTDNGLCRFDPVTERFQLYNKKNNLQGLTFNIGAFQTSDGEMYFGGDHGVNAFYPTQIKLDTIAPMVVLTDLDINGKPATIAKDGQMALHVSVTKDIQLSHNLNELTFHFTSLLFDRGSESQFAYKLSPGDKDWVQSGGIRQAHYTNLSPGEYTFTSKASNADGVWNETGFPSTFSYYHPGGKPGPIIFGFFRYRNHLGIHLLSFPTTAKGKPATGAKGYPAHGPIESFTEELKSTQSQLIQSEKWLRSVN
jgi:hypothetical protein